MTSQGTRSLMPCAERVVGTVGVAPWSRPLAPDRAASSWGALSEGSIVAPPPCSMPTPPCPSAGGVASADGWLMEDLAANSLTASSSTQGLPSTTGDLSALQQGDLVPPDDAVLIEEEEEGLRNVSVQRGASSS